MSPLNHAMDDLMGKVFGVQPHDASKLEVPASWECAAKASEAEDGIERFLAEDVKNASVQKEAAPVSGKEALLTEAIASNKIRATDKVGRMLEAQKKIDSALSCSLAAAKTHAAMQDIRLAWAKAELSKIKQSKYKKDEHEFSSVAKGRYKPFGKIVADEGGDSAAWKAAVNIVKSCLTLHKANKTIKGQSFMKYNWMSKRTEFMHLETGFDDIQRELEGTEERSEQPEQGEPTEAREEPLEKPAAEKPAAEPPKAPNKEAPPAEEDGKKRKKKESGANLDDKKRRKKEFEKGFKIAAGVKERMNQALAIFADIKNWVASDSSWGWADTVHTMGPLKELADKIEAHKRSSRFCMAWTMHQAKSFPSVATATFKEDVISCELSKMPDFEKDVAYLHTKLQQVKESHLAMNKDA